MSWFVDYLSSFTSWLGAWLGFFFTLVSGSFNFIVDTTTSWLTWAAEGIKTVILGITTDIATYLMWVKYYFNNLLTYILQAGEWIARTFLNFLTDWLINPLFLVWNEGIYPYLLTAYGYILAQKILSTTLYSLWTQFWDILWSFFQWGWSTFIVDLQIPMAFYNGFLEAVNPTGVQATDLAGFYACQNGEWFCGVIAGLELLDMSLSHAILYPLVIIAIVVGTVTILWKNILFMWNGFLVDLGDI